MKQRLMLSACLLAQEVTKGSLTQGWHCTQLLQCRVSLRG